MVGNVIKTKTIKLKRYNEIEIERQANAAGIYPGMLIQLLSNDKVQPHGTGNAPLKMFALEDEVQGRDIDTPYAANDIVSCGIFNGGDVVYALLADGEDIAIGDPLESAGGGLLKKYVPAYGEAESLGLIEIFPERIVGIAKEAVDTSGSSGEESSISPLGYVRRIKVFIT